MDARTKSVYGSLQEVLLCAPRCIELTTYLVNKVVREIADKAVFVRHRAVLMKSDKELVEAS